jgi:hypothetical protein
MKSLLEIRDSRPAEAVLHVVIGVIALAIGLWMLQEMWPTILYHKADWFRVGAVVIVVIIGLWALIDIPQATLRAYRMHLIFSYGIWPLSIFMRVRVHNSDIMQIRAVEHDPVDFPVGWGTRGARYGNSRRWTIRGSRYGRGVFIASTRGNYVISCEYPQDIASRLKKIVGLE